MKKYRIVRVEERNESYFIIEERIFLFLWEIAIPPNHAIYTGYKYKTLEEAESEIAGWLTGKPIRTVQKSV